MNRDLISNPFLFPPTGDNEEEKGLFLTHAEKLKSDILFQLKDFNQVWQVAEKESLEAKDRYLFDFPISSPTISTTSTELVSFGGEMDDNLMTDFDNFDFDHCEFSPILTGNDLDKDSFSLQEKPLSEDDKQSFVQTTNQALHQINDLGELTMFPAYNNAFGKKMPAEEEKNTLLGSNLIEGESVWLPGSNVFNILDIVKNDPAPPVSTPLSTINPAEIMMYQESENSQAASVKVEPISQVQTTPQANSRPGRQRRKSVQTSRNIQEDSPMTFQQDEESVDLEAMTAPELKAAPTVSFALAPLNGTSNRSRNVSATSSTASFASPSSSKARASKSNETERRKRKYECEDETDPSVKNAKAAKMNRDKKKMQMQQLKEQVTELSSENQDLKQKLEEERRMRLQNDEHNTQQISILTQMLQTEQSKNAANSKQKVTMFDLMRNMVSTIQPAPTVICLTERLGSTSMPDPSEMDNIRAMTSQPTSGLDTYLSVKVGIGGIPSITFDCENSKHD